jgi:Tol biopolymer transport system component
LVLVTLLSVGPSANQAGNQTGHLSIMDEQGQKQEVAGTKDVILPAWSADGAKIAFLQKNGKNKYDLVIMNVKQ